jgi:hypothetical protein
MLGQGLDPKTIASITDHRDPSVILKNYSRTNEDHKLAALNAIKLSIGV